ncbi:hypothetical protein L9F63_003353, partial [Diploptera punctata]
ILVGFLLAIPINKVVLWNPFFFFFWYILCSGIHVWRSSLYFNAISLMKKYSPE